VLNNKLNHLAIIMDGNGRWAEKKNLPRSEGHEKGLENIKNICELAIKSEIKFLTLFSLSSENLFRPKNEILFLIDLVDHALDFYLKFIVENQIIFNFFGDDSILNHLTISRIKNLQRITNEKFSSSKNLVLNIAFNYGGRQEILFAINNIIQKKISQNSFQNNSNEMKKENLISEDDLRSNFYLPQIPDPDLIIRTGGYQRLSNFLLWQSAYSELYFCDDFWPEFEGHSLEKAIQHFHLQKRNFGLLS
jgi:undecaprenyl diphosphate synthase